MRIAMPSPRGTNLEGLYLDGAAYDALPNNARDRKFARDKRAADRRAALDRVSGLDVNMRAAIDKALDDLDATEKPEEGMDDTDMERLQNIAAYLKDHLSSDEIEEFKNLIGAGSKGKGSRDPEMNARGSKRAAERAMDALPPRLRAAASELMIKADARRRNDFLKAFPNAARLMY